MTETIVVLGATGAQGGGVVDALVANGKFSVRAVTRNPDSEKAKALASKKDVQVVKADIDDVDSLVDAFSGAYGAFFVTNFWEHMNAEKEIQQVRNLADAAQKAGLKHVVNSTLEDTRPFFNEQENRPAFITKDMFVPHFDGKGAMNEEVAKKVPTTQVFTSFYFENFISFGMGPKPDQEGNLAINFNMGDKAMPMISVKDIGRVAAKVFEDSSLIGKEIYISSRETLACGDAAKAFSKLLGKPVAYNNVPYETYIALGFPGAHELGTMFRFFAESPDFEKVRTNDEIAKKLVPDMVTFESFLNENKKAFE